MAVEAADMEFYLSANTPDDDSSTSGGAIDATVQLMCRTLSKELNSGSGDVIDVVSSDAGDIHNVVIQGYGTDGTWISETLAITGTTNAHTTATFLHLCSVIQAEAGDGTLTVGEYNGGGAVNEIFVTPIGEKGCQDLFLKAEANASGGATKKFYEKLFIKNTHATDALISCVVWLNEDEDTELTMDCEMSGDATLTGGSETTTNRVTEPSTGGTYAWAEHATEGAGHTMGDAEDGNMIAAEAQGVWVELTLADGRTPEQVVEWAPKIHGSAT